MIRFATVDDIPRMVEMGREFREQSTYAKLLADNPGKMAELGKRLIDANGLIVADRDGEVQSMLGFVFFDHFISGEKFAGEVFWYAAHRGAGLMLWKEFERLAKKAGCVKIQMVAPNDKVATLYQHRNYEFMESAYQKSL